VDPADEALVMAVTQKAPVGSTFANKVTVPAWKSKPSWYQISSEDRMIVPANEKRMAERIGAKKIITLSSGHASPERFALSSRRACDARYTNGIFSKLLRNDQGVTSLSPPRARDYRQLNACRSLKEGKGRVG
jgi:hypothetical protein